MRHLTYLLVAAVAFCAGAFWAVTAPARAQADKDRPPTTNKIISLTGDAEIDGKTLAQWMKYAKHPDPADRKLALTMIALFGEDAKKKALPLLIATLKDKDQAVQGSAVVTLQKICVNLDPTEINQNEFNDLVKGLVGNLHSGVAYARVQAAYALGNIGPAAKDAIEPLVRKTIKESYSYEIRQAAAAALGRVAYDDKKGPDYRAVAALCSATRDDSYVVRLQALTSLIMLGVPKKENDKTYEKRALERLIQQERNRTVQIWAHMFLAELDEALKFLPQAAKNVDKVAEHLQKETDPQNRVHAAAALAALGAKAKGKVPTLIVGLKDPQPVVTAACISALGRLKEHVGAADVRTIIKLLDPMEMPETRAAAAAALGAIGATGRIPLLIELLRDDEDPVANAAAGALAQMKDSLTKPQIDAIAGMLGDKKQKLTVRCRAAQALGAIGQKSKIPNLVEALKDKDSAVAASAVAGLAAMQKELSAEHVQGIVQLLRDKDKPPEMRGFAAQALGVLGDKAKPHIPDLIAALKDKEVLVIQSAILALAHFGKDAKPALDVLTELKKHRDPLIRDSAARAIDIIEGKKSQDNKPADH
jgi:HEAT repeat protein